MSLPSAVVFDLGKVLLDFDYRLAAKKFEDHCRLSAREIGEMIDQSPLLLQYECSAISTEQFFDKVRQLTGFRGDLALFSEMFGDIFTPVNRMIELNAALRSRGVPTYIFSNTNPLAVGHIRRRYPFFRDFHGHVLSCDHGAMKPDARLYEVVENVTGRKGAELLYIDDRAENVEAGRARGWRSILHRNPEMTWKEVAETGLLNGDLSRKEF